MTVKISAYCEVHDHLEWGEVVDPKMGKFRFKPCPGNKDSDCRIQTKLVLDIPR